MKFHVMNCLANQNGNYYEFDSIIQEHWLYLVTVVVDVDPAVGTGQASCGGRGRGRTGESKPHLLTNRPRGHATQNVVPQSSSWPRIHGHTTRDTTYRITNIRGDRWKNNIRMWGTCRQFLLHYIQGRELCMTIPVLYHIWFFTLPYSIVQVMLSINNLYYIGFHIYSTAIHHCVTYQKNIILQLNMSK